MKGIRYSFLKAASFLLFVTASGLSALPVYASDGENTLKDSNSLRINDYYQGQTTFRCNGLSFKIPAYLPFVSRLKEKEKTKSFLSAKEKNCTNTSFAVTLRIDPNCEEPDLCSNVSFTFVPKNLQGDLVQTMITEGKKIELSKHINGYFIPSVCGANCSDSALYWQDQGKIYIIQTIYYTPETINELIKSANSYIELGQ